MRMPSDDLRTHAAKYLHNHFVKALATPDSLSIDWPLHPSTAANAARNVAVTQDFSASGSAGRTKKSSTTNPAIGLGQAWAPIPFPPTRYLPVLPASPLPQALPPSTPARYSAHTTSLRYSSAPLHSATHVPHLSPVEGPNCRRSALLNTMLDLAARPYELRRMRARHSGRRSGWQMDWHPPPLVTRSPLPFRHHRFGAAPHRCSPEPVLPQPRLRVVRYRDSPLPSNASLPRRTPRILIVEDKQTFLALALLSDATPSRVAILGSGNAARQLHALD